MQKSCHFLQLYGKYKAIFAQYTNILNQGSNDSISLMKVQIAKVLTEAFSKTNKILCHDAVCIFFSFMLSSSWIMILSSMICVTLKLILK